MTANELATRDTAAMLERLVVDGDLSKLTPDQKVQHYVNTCESLNLNWRTKPFAYLRLNGKEVLYAQRDCTDQLRKLNGVSIVSLERERIDDLYMVTATAKLPDGRTDSAIGAVPIAGLKGEALANAFMKAETKSKRRVTLSICGLGMTDESEVGSIPGAQTIEMTAIPSETHVEAPQPPVSQEHAMESARESWVNLQVAGAEVGIDIPNIETDHTLTEIKEAYNGYRDQVIAARRKQKVTA